MKLVKFIRPWSKYSPGDIAGFEEDRADALIKVGAAKPCDAEEPDEAGAQPAPAGESAEASADHASAEGKPARGPRSKQ